MKIKAILLLTIVVGLFVSASEPYDYSAYKPVFMERESFEAAVKTSTPRDLENPGKIYRYDKYMLVVEKYFGVHMIDVSDPANPQNVSFVVIPGCGEVAMHNGFLYASSAVDLVTVDLRSYPSVSVTNRKKDVFPEMLSPDDELPWEYTENNRPKNTEIIAWVKK